MITEEQIESIRESLLEYDLGPFTYETPQWQRDTIRHALEKAGIKA